MSTWLLGAARKVAIGILIISVLSDCACFFDKQSISEKIKKANHVEITFFNLKTGKGDEHVRTITTISELQSISQYLDSSMLSRANFSADLCKVKMNLGDSFLDITFYNGAA